MDPGSCVGGRYRGHGHVVAFAPRGGRSRRRRLRYPEAAAPLSRVPRVPTGGAATRPDAAAVPGRPAVAACEAVVVAAGGARAAQAAPVLPPRWEASRLP